MFSEISLVVSLKVRIYNGGKKTVFPRFTLIMIMLKFIEKNSKFKAYKIYNSMAFCTAHGKKYYFVAGTPEL